eukprot:scaffold7377_cov389-Prasinococcus_capsulatus_cf.AAC.32
MQLKPQILDQFLEKESVIPAGLGRFSAENDSLVLEETSGRVNLVGECVKVGELLTGVVVGAKGALQEDGSFRVSELILPELAPQPALPDATREAKYIALVSGLTVGTENSNPLPTQLLVDYICGNLGSQKEQELCSRIVRVVIAGDSFSGLDKVPLSSAVKDNQQHRVTAPCRDLDMVLSELASAVPVDVMAGPNDPANRALPQQPLHLCLVPTAAQYSTYKPVTNPYSFSCDEVKFLGSSGQNIDDMFKYSTVEVRVVDWPA